MVRNILSALILLLFVVFLSACGDGGVGFGPADVVETYLQALVSKDSVLAINSSCLDWEEGAQREIDSFETVEAFLVEPDCEKTGEQDEFTLVQCSGKIVFVYGDEQQDLVLVGKTYLVIQEDGEWRMCGYQ